MSPSNGDTSLGQAVLAKDLSKSYRIYDKPFHRLLDLVVPGKKRFREFWAVRNVYLDIRRGSTVGMGSLRWRATSSEGMSTPASIAS